MNHRITSSIAKTTAVLRIEKLKGSTKVLSAAEHNSQIAHTHHFDADLVRMHVGEADREQGLDTQEQDDRRQEDPLEDGVLEDRAKRAGRAPGPVAFAARTHLDCPTTFVFRHVPGLCSIQPVKSRPERGQSGG